MKKIVWVVSLLVLSIIARDARATQLSFESDVTSGSALGNNEVRGAGAALLTFDFVPLRTAIIMGGHDAETTASGFASSVVRSSSQNNFDNGKFEFNVASVVNAFGNNVDATGNHPPTTSTAAGNRNELSGIFNNLAAATGDLVVPPVFANTENVAIAAVSARDAMVEQKPQLNTGNVPRGGGELLLLLAVVFAGLALFSKGEGKRGY